jgi:pimeloyl-ACP methyl ester carboxylesterase
MLDHGGSGPVLHWAPANGFPLATYRPLIDGLANRYRSVTIPPRALWPDIGPPPEGPGSWWELAEDLVRGLQQHLAEPVVAIGHSSGGVASLLATLLDRSRFRALVLLDPTILAPAIMDQFRRAKATGWKAAAHPIAARARERRSQFGSHAEAFAFWRDKALFRDWSDDALRLYVGGILRPLPHRGFTLTWSGAWEAYYFESIETGIWEDLSRLDPSLPILAVGGASSDVFGRESMARFRERVPWATIATVEGGHLFPQTSPQATFRILEAWLNRLVAR